MNELYDAAMDYHLRRKLPITLCVGKRPLGKDWPNKRYTVDEINQRYREQPSLNVGTRMAELVDVEYDGPGGEHALLELFEGDVPVTPTWMSHRGPHRLFQSHPELQSIGKAVLYFGPLEIRLGNNAQSLLPPSATDGYRRNWQVSLDECDPAPWGEGAVRRLVKASIGEIQPKQVPSMTHRRHRRHKQSVSSVCHGPAAAKTLTEAVKAAIVATLPGNVGQRHRQIFHFARYLKAIPTLADAEFGELQLYVEWWHQEALPAIKTKAFEETWFDFRNAWVRVRFAAGQEPIALIYAEALSKRLPKCSLRYEQQPLQALVALCRELQGVAGKEPFFIACRAAAALVGTEHKTAARWLKMLCVDGILELCKAGTRHQASEYRYRGD